MKRFAATWMIGAWAGLVVPPGAFAATAEPTVRCESSARETVRCKADTRGGVVLQRQLSRAGCWYDETWGFDKSGVWVSNGCRADFALGRSNASSATAPAATPKPPPAASSADDGVGGTGLSGGQIAAGALVIGAIAAAVIASKSSDDDDDGDSYQRNRNRRGDPWSRDQVVRCESNGKNQRYCKANTKRGVELYRQLSKTRCRYGSSWGYDRKGIWVDEGCRADFLVRG